MNSYFTLLYLGVFLPAVLIIYGVVPQKARGPVLLGASYVFFWSVSGKLLMYLLISTFSIHHMGLWMADAQKDRKKKKAIAVFGALLHVGLLVTLKYAGFFVGNLNSLLEALHIPASCPVPDLAAPIGISFYTLQAISYILDVSRGTVQADRNLGRLALYMSFFPQLMEGPICRYSDTAERLWQGEKIRYQNLAFGAQRMLFGLIKKVVVADRLNLLIKNVFGNYGGYDGGVIALAVVCYTCQLYMEFSGTMDVVIGTGELFGFRLPENFRRPFFSRTISEFWQRWHITLGGWFRDYIFYPMSLTKPLKKLTSAARKRLGAHYGPLVSGSIALFSVWLCNGLWHGAGWHYIFFGMYHFVLILGGSLLAVQVQKVSAGWHISRDSVPYRGVQILRTCCLVCVGELFFRAEGLRNGLAMFKKMITEFSFQSLGNGAVFQLGMDKKDFLIVGAAVLLVLAVSILGERGVSVRSRLAERPAVFRWAVLYGAVLLVVIFGAYGKGYVPVDPIYANF